MTEEQKAPEETQAAGQRARKTVVPRKGGTRTIQPEQQKEVSGDAGQS